jgi:hypothetical protein
MVERKEKRKVVLYNEAKRKYIPTTIYKPVVEEVMSCTFCGDQVAQLACKS